MLQYPRLPPADRHLYESRSASTGAVCGIPGENVGRVGADCSGAGNAGVTRRRRAPPSWVDLAPILIEEYGPQVSENTGNCDRARGLCAYCGNESDDLTEDHVIPRALQRVQVTTALTITKMLRA